MTPTNSVDAPSWLVRARREIGVKEIVGKRHNPRVLQYHATTRLKATTDETAWCAAFVCWCLENEGVTSTKSAAAASYKGWGRPSPLVPGAVIVFGKRDPDAVGTGHVGFVDAYPEDGLVWVVSGNCGNMVKRKQYSVGEVVACRWPVF